METMKMKSGKEISIPTTGEDWQLYTYSMKCGTAARALTAALKKVLVEIDANASKGYAPTSRGADALIGKHIYPVMRKYSDFGAEDTEPRYVAYHTVEQAIERLTGHRVYL